MEEEKRLIFNELNSSKLLKIIGTTSTNRFPKTVSASVQARKDGNVLYGKAKHTSRTHEEILKLYSKSIAMAPKNSEELALAYGNRSALLLHITKYKECMQDIVRAIKITKSPALIKKLTARKEDCAFHLAYLESKSNSKKVGDEGFNISKEFEKLLVDESCPETIRTSLLPDLIKKEAENTFNSVSIKYNEKYGRYLVANRDIKPGEIIFVEKPYVSCLNIKKPYIHCCHCLSIAWAGIPCDKCGWFVFCSEKCKNEAWGEYHFIECICVPYITHFLSFISQQTGERVMYDGLSIRTLLKGLREVGGLENLKRVVNSLENCTDKRTKGFSKDGKFENNKFISIFSLTSNIPLKEMNYHVTFAAVTLICLAKYTPFFGKNFEYCDLEKLSKHPDVIFVGAVLLRLAKISNVNSHGIINVNDDCRHQNDVVTCRKNYCCMKGVCIVPVASLTNNSCNPNARRCFTDDLKFIIYAVQPIKKNSQIFDSYFCSFFEMPNPHRQQSLMENFNFKCDCSACKENWPYCQIIGMNFELLIISNAISLNPKEMEVWTRNKKLIESVEHETVIFDQNLLDNISKAIEYSIKSLAQPSVVTCKFIHTLIQVFEGLYGYKLEVFNDCCY